MAEEFNPNEAGRHIAAEYLNKRGWVLDWRRSLGRQLAPGFEREKLEEKERQCDQMEQEAEDVFSQKVERWRRDGSPAAKQVLRRIVDQLGQRTDLGFFAKRLVDRLKHDLSPF